MRWPFGPPHLTLKPSKKNKKQKTKKKEKEQKKKNKGQKTKKLQNTKKELFSYLSIFSFFLVGVQNFPFLTTWPEKRAPKKHYKNGGGFQQPILWKTVLSHETAIFGQEKPNPEIPLICFFFAFFFSYNNKKHKN